MSPSAGTACGYRDTAEHDEQRSLQQPGGGSHDRVAGFGCNVYTTLLLDHETVSVEWHQMMRVLDASVDGVNDTEVVNSLGRGSH